MTVTAQTSSNSSTGNGVTTVFPYTFKIIDDGDIEVRVDGVLKTLSTHYTVSGVGDNAGGNVTMLTAPANGAIVARRRNMALVRATDYQYQGNLPAAVLNPDQDAPVLMVQQMQEQISRSARGPAGETWAELPAAADRLDLFPVFDATTGALELSTVTQTQVASAVAAAYAAGSTADAVTFLQAGTGATTRTVQAKLRETVSVTDFGAVGDGVADDTAAFTSAFTALGTAGGTVVVSNDMRCLIDGNLTIPVNCAIVGPHKYVGSPGNNTAAPYGTMGGALIVNSAATITVNSNASITGFLIHRKGMTFPTTDAASFAGTAITINGDDSAISHCLILGFNKAIYSTGDQRQQIHHINFDCVNGIEITACLDIPYIAHCHGWPFATIEASAAGTPGASIIRTGIGFYLHDTVDWAKVTDCFTYGYYRGFQLETVNSCTLLSCGADNVSSGGTPTHTGSIGFVIGGQENRLIGCQAAAQDSAGVSVASTTGVHQTIVGLNIWACGTHGVLLSGGDLTISNSNFRSVGNGISIASTSSRVVDGGGNRFESITGSPWNFASASDTGKVRLGTALSDKAAGNAIVTGTFVAESVASAASLNLPVNGDCFTITGTTNFGTLNGGWAGRQVTLVFAGILSVFSSTGSTGAMRLSGGATFNTAANNTLTLLHTGTQWLEIGRCA